MHDFKKLRVWNKSIELATEIYMITKKFPADERFSLIYQIRKSVVSISSNIAEAAGRSGKKEFSYHLHVAYGSTLELETQIIISRNLEYLTARDFDEVSGRIREIQKMLFALARSLGPRGSSEY